MSQQMEIAELGATASNNLLIRDYLLEHEAEFRKLCDLKRQGWSSANGDQFFQVRRNKADTAGQKEREGFFRMTIMIGDEMAEKMQVFDLQNRGPHVLDVCMAPGGFAESVITRFPHATVHALTLPSERGGHEVMAKSGNLSIVFADITMYAAEFGVETVPIGHPDAANFSMDRPYLDSTYDLVFCGGALLRKQSRAKYREKVESTRLTLSQLIFAFQRIKKGGTLVLLLHRVELWDTVRILYAFWKFAEIRLFKPRKAHAIKSSFYLVAKNVQPQSPEAMTSISEWKRRWYEATFEISEADTSQQVISGQDESKDASLVLKEFGPHLSALGRAVWRTQAKALEKSGFLTGRQSTGRGHVA